MITALWSSIYVPTPAHKPPAKHVVVSIFRKRTWSDSLNHPASYGIVRIGVYLVVAEIQRHHAILDWVIKADHV